MLSASTCGWPHATLFSWQIAVISAMADTTLGACTDGGNQDSAISRLRNDHDSYAGDFLQYLRQVLDAIGVFAHDADEDFTFGIERPDVGAIVIFLCREAPVTRGSRRPSPRCPFGS
jgi:hypothetical protein